MAVSYWRRRDQYYRLVGSRCSECGAEFYPPVHRCRRCGARSLEEKPMPEEGVVVTWTRLYEPMKGFEDQVPLTLAIIRLTNGVRVLAQIADDQGNLAIGDRVKLTLRRIRAEGEEGPIFYGYKFVKE